MKHWRSGLEHSQPRQAAAVDLESDDAPGLGADDRLTVGHGPHHDPSIHTERESFTVTTQRCRGEYP
jgi:hypothetical protein